MNLAYASRDAGGFVRQVAIDADADTGRYPYTLPVVQSLLRQGELALDPRVTFLVGNNGTGKSTLMRSRDLLIVHTGPPSE